MNIAVDKISRLFNFIALFALTLSINITASHANEFHIANAAPKPPSIFGESITTTESTTLNTVNASTLKLVDNNQHETVETTRHERANNDQSGTTSANRDKTVETDQPETVDNPASETNTEPKTDITKGNTYYVSSAGDDASFGTETKPWRNIQRAAEKLVAGDTVVVLPGVYNELVKPFNSGTKLAPITFIGYGAVIDGTGLGKNPLFSVNGKSYIHIEGFEIRNSEHDGLMVLSTKNNAAIGITIDSITVHDTRRNGIMIARNNQPSYTRITNSKVFRTQQAGIVLWKNYGGHFLIEKNEVFDWQGIGNWDGIEVVDTPYTVIRNNKVHDGGGKNPGADYIDVGGDQTLEISHTHHILVENNLVYKSTGPGALKVNNRPKYAIIRNNRSWKVPMVFYEQPHAHVSVYHNTVVDTDSHPLQLWNKDKPNSSFGGMIVKNNIFAFGGKGLQHGPLEMDGSANALLMTNNLYRPTAAWGWKNGASTSDYYRVEDSESEYQRWRKEARQEPNDLGIRTMLTQDEIFSDIANLDFTLATTSPGINQATALTFVRGSGFGKVLTLGNSDYFFDGYNGLTSGDMIEIGEQGVARILKINEQTHEITIDREINWNDYDSVYMAGKLGSAPDIGAVESF